jgi:uncharacterized membrane protein YuzA (DUF378 family)
MENKLNVWDWIAIVLIIIGALNWGLVGVFKWDLVKAIFGDMTVWSRTVYDLVGIAAIYLIVVLPSLGRKS